MLSHLILLGLLAFLGCRTPERIERVPAPWELDEVRASVSDIHEGPAMFVPADVRVYARLVGASDMLEGDHGNPLAREVWTTIQEIAPAGFWGTAAPELGLEDAEFMRELFGQDIALIERAVADPKSGRKNRAAVLLMRVRPELLRKLPEAAGLAAWEVASSIGPWSLFTGGEVEEDPVVIATSENWLALASLRKSNHLLSLLTAKASGATVLGDDEGFRDLKGRLPEQRDGIMFTQSRDQKEQHAVSLHQAATRLEVRYAARSIGVERHTKPLLESDGVDFGALPEDVLVAGSINVIPEKIPGESFLNFLLFPRTVKGSVIPGITPPIHFFMGKIDRERVAPDPGFTLPVFGLVIRLKNPGVAAYLDEICSDMHFYASLSEFSVLKGFFGIASRKFEGTSYHVADFAPIIRSASSDEWLSKLAKRKAAKAITRLVYGRVGNDYVICNQELFFQDWIQGSKNGRPLLSQTADFKAFELQDEEGLILSAVTRGEKLSGIVGEISRFLESTDDKLKDDRKPDATGDKSSSDGDVAEKDIVADPVDEESENERSRAKDRNRADKVQNPLRWIARGLDQSNSYSLQLWSTEENYVFGRLIATTE